MAVTKTVLKKVRQQAVVKFVGDGTANVDLDTDLKLADETFLGYANTNVTITGMVWSVTDSIAAPVVIKRPYTATANTAMLFGNDNWSLTQMFGFVDSANASSNIQIQMPATGGTLYLTVTKNNGYQEPNQQTKV
jgi:hypothetical protein